MLNPGCSRHKSRSHGRVRSNYISPVYCCLSIIYVDSRSKYEIAMNNFPWTILDYKKLMVYWDGKEKLSWKCWQRTMFYWREMAEKGGGGTSLLSYAQCYYNY